MRQVIKSEVLQRVKDDEVLTLKIAQFLGKKFRTVYQWVLDNSDQLQTPAVLQMIKTGLGYKTDDEILEVEAEAVRA